MSNGPVEYPVIVWLGDKQPNQHWVLEKDSMTLGRDDVCDIVIPQRQISRQHIIFHRSPQGTYLVEDLESKNGTWVNGHRLEGLRELTDGDEIHVALKIRLRFIGSGITAPITQNLPEVIPSIKFTGRLRIDSEARRVFVLDNEVDPPLSVPQYRLLELLFLSNGSVCSREEIVEAVWPDVDGAGVSEQAIDALIRRLRDRLNEIDPEWQYIVTVRGHGFRLDNPLDG